MRRSISLASGGDPTNVVNLESGKPALLTLVVLSIVCFKLLEEDFTECSMGFRNGDSVVVMQLDGPVLMWAGSQDGNQRVGSQKREWKARSCTHGSVMV